MSQGFFSYFPTLQYNDQIVTNVLAKVRFDQAISKNLAHFYPYTVKEGERPDQIANWYYGDPYYDWVIYLSNNTVDPYFEWPSTQNQLRDYIIAKFGSEANAQQQICFYRNNYYGDDTILDVPGYSALSDVQKFYWMPVAGADGSAVGYERKPADIIVDTNATLQLTGDFSNSAARAENVYVTQSAAAGFVGFSNTSVLMLRHITGNFVPGTCSAGTISVVTPGVVTIPAGAAPYYSPVSEYEYAEELNESRKNIRLLQVQYLDVIVRDMKDLL